jgi:hypothetical protein
MSAMPLTWKDQAQLLRDILSDHQLDCCGTVSECEQLERLAKSLMANINVDQRVKSTLQQIYQYSQDGQYTQHLDEHIQAHQNHLSQWVSDIDQLS